MSVLLMRASRWRHPANNMTGAFRRTISRFESTVVQAKNEPANVNLASSATTKAADGLNRVTSATSPALKGAGKVLKNVMHQSGRVISFIQHQIPPTIYYARVGIEFSKLVFHGQKMMPPPVSTFQSYLEHALQSIRNPNSLLSSISPKNSQDILQNARSLTTSELAAGAVLVAELLGFFTVGEIIGRFKFIGYRGEVVHHH